jgi:hypothetical protein
MGKSGKKFREINQKRDQARKKKIDARFTTEKPKPKDKQRKVA